MRDFLATISLLFVFGTVPVAQGMTSSSPGGAGNANGKQTPKEKIIRPGDDCHDNGDVEVCNTTPHGGGNRAITVDPAMGNGGSATTIEFDNEAQGTVTELDANDTVNLNAGSVGNIIGAGGTVNVMANSASGTVTNNGSGTTNIRVNLPHGTTVYVPPGSSIGFGPTT
jgi:hypothetical protein